LEQITKNKIRDLVGVGDGRSHDTAKDVQEGNDLQEDAVRSLKTENETAENGFLTDKEEDINPWQFLSLGPTIDKPEEDMVADYGGSDDDLKEVTTETAVEGGEEAMPGTVPAAAAEERMAALRETQLLNLAGRGEI
jgi:hypothetical protein